MKNSLALSFIQSTTECFVCPVSFHLTLWDKIFHNAREISHGFVLPVTADATERVIQVDPCLIWHMLFFFFYLPVTASHHRRKYSRFLPHRSHPPVTESSISVQVVRKLFHSVFLLIALICFLLLTISKAKVSDWARCPRHVLWAFRVLGALLSGC